jgi:homoserine kinase
MVDHHFRVRIPGSTSNLGSGFDTVSAALDLYLTLEVRKATGDRIEWIADWQLDPDENIILKALERTCSALETKSGGLVIEVDNQIPLKRGLGSSAAAIVGGIKIAEKLSGQRLTANQVFDLAYPLEGHPDNLSASLLGGWVVSRVSNGRMRAERLESSLDCRFVLAVPEVEVSTAEARGILASSFSLEDTVFNLQRCALLVHAISSGKPHLLAEATRDRIHQEARAGLVPGARSVLAGEDLPTALQDSVVSVTVSGSGSSLLAIVSDQNEEVGRWMTDVFSKHGVAAQTFVLELDPLGARSE